MKRYRFSLPIFLNSSQLFFLLHDKHFETNKKNSNRIDESIIFSSLLSLEKTAFVFGPLAFCLSGYSRKNPNRAVEDMELPEVSKK